VKRGPRTVLLPFAGMADVLYRGIETIPGFNTMPPKTCFAAEIGA